MMRIILFAAIVICAASAVPSFGQPPDLAGAAPGGLSRLTRDYRPQQIPATRFEDSSRLADLMRAGSIYLSLRDAIALALENNLDIEYARYTPKLSEANLLRARAGTVLRNVSTSISSASAPASEGVLAGTALGSGGSNLTSTGNQGGLFSGLNVQVAGSAIPNLDPVLFANTQLVHTTTIQTATNITGVDSLVTQYEGASYGFQQGFTTGTNIAIGMNNQFHLTQNSFYNMYNPFDQSDAVVNVQQNLLQGFRRSVNRRFIIVARNQQHVSELTFQNQVMATVTNVVNLYWELVYDREILAIRQQALDQNTSLYDDNQRRVRLGAVSQLDIAQAEAAMRASRRDVASAQSQVLQQETLLKNVLTRTGIDELSILSAHVMPTEHFDMPDREQVRPIQDLMTEAMSNRPDVEQSRIGLEDAQISMRGTKDALLPQLTAFANLANGGVAGRVNTIPTPVVLPDGTTQFLTRTPADVDPSLLGGYGSVLRQIFSRNFPNYTLGVQLSIPLRNRSAQADLITDELNYRQQQIQDRQLKNNVKASVVNARTELSQAREVYDDSLKSSMLQEEVLAGMRRKYELGTESLLDVVITQRDTTTAELAAADAKNRYIHAHTNLENATGAVLRNHNVDIDEAKSGKVLKAPDLIPVVK